MYNFRTDLALERRDIYQKANNLKQIDGVESTEEKINEKLKVTRVEITNQNGEKAIGKPIGNYVTIDVKNLKLAEDEDIQRASEVVANELRKIIELHTDKHGDILVVGLGNLYVTPDALGPKVINEIDVTRHIIKYLPQFVDEDTRPVSAISPGVDRMLMLLTGADSIKEVIAFPLNSKAQDLMMGAPSNVNKNQLREVHIKLDIK